ncbi:MAG: hypothetical protein EWM72_00960 [Nitrospira sp.]|nr:MAG: hypothetical protein EWM72_00960 [Nitrospira sp.]
MKFGTTQTQPQTEDPRTWIGGEATVGCKSTGISGGKRGEPSTHSAPSLD